MNEKSKTNALIKMCILYQEKSRFIKEQEARGSLSSLKITVTGIKIIITKEILIARDILFLRYKMYKLINKFLLAGDEFMT